MALTKRNLLAGAAALVASVKSATAAQQRAADGGQDLTLEVRKASLRLRGEGPETSLLRYGEGEPVPTLHARVGQPVRLQIVNTLANATSLQVCGVRGQGSLDTPGMTVGATVPGGGAATLRFTPVESGTAWLRPRLGPPDQAGQGLAGVLVVEAADAPPVDHDLVCFLRDWTLDPQNQLVLDGAPLPAGAAALVTLGNKPLPMTQTVRPGARLRLRLVNGSTRRVMVVAVEGTKPIIVAVDGQPSEPFQPIRNTVPIGPGARFDLMCDLPRAPAQSVRLTLRGIERAGAGPEPDQVIAILRTDGDVVAARPPITGLPPNPALPPKIPLEASKRAELKIERVGGMWTVNGISGDELPKLPILRVKQGAAVTLGFTNASSDLVPLSLYGQAMRLLHPNDDGWEPYWRDNVLLPPGSRNHVAFMADIPGRWPIESGFNAQAVAGLRCWFEVTPA